MLCASAFGACTGSSPTWTTTPDRASVAACLTGASRNDTINVLSGSATWSSTLTVTRGVKLIGAGPANSSTTVITNGTGASGILINIQPDATAIANSETIRIENFTFDANGGIFYMIEVGGASYTDVKPYRNFLITGNLFRNSSCNNDTMVITTAQARGVIWNNTFDRIQYPFRPFGGDDQRIWQNSAFYPFSYGSSDNVYFESNTIHYTSSFSCNDAGWMESGQDGRWVVRFNTWNLTNVPNSTDFQDSHGAQNFYPGSNSVTGNGQTSTMITEWYRNTITTPNSYFRWAMLRGSWQIFFDNNITSPGTPYIDVLQYAVPPDSTAGCYNYIQNLDGSAWTGPDMTINNTYVFNNLTNGVLTGARAHTGDVHNNNCGVVENGATSPYGTGVLYGFWNQTNSFNGTVGVGRGVLASKPATCTTGVGYWATDQGSWNTGGSGGQGVFYKCTATNTWTQYYTPYTYPNPLTAGSLPQAATPTFSPVAGSYSPFVNVTPSDITAGAFICWNLTGAPGPINGATSCPAGSYRYFNPITLTVTTHIYFIAGGPGLVDSAVLDAGLFTLPTPNGTAPNYLSTTTTANVGTVAPLFNASSAVNSTAFDTSYNPSPMDCYTRLTNGTTFGGKSVGNNSFSGGSNDVMFSKAGTYVGIEQGGATFIFHLDLSGVCGKLINTGNLTGSGGIHLANGFGASRVTDNVFYTENADTQVQQSTIINDTTVNTITLVDVADGATCPGLPFPFGATHGGILSVSEDDSRFAWVLSNAGGQGTGVWLVVWDRQLGCAVENYGAVDAVTNPLGGSYWAFCKGSCGPSTPPTGSLDSFNTCTNGGNCSCWGGPSHGGQLSLDGNYFMVTQNAGTPWTQGACSGVNVATMLSIWTVGTSTTQFCNSAPGTQVGGQYCDGHESVGVNHMVSAINNVYSNRALSNTLAYTQFQTSFLTQHGYWPHPNNDDSAPWINATSNQVVSGAGSIFAPFNLVNTAYAAYPNSVNKAFTIFGHTYSCNPTNSTLWQQCSGPDWTASTSYTLNQVVTPLVNNAGNDSFQVTTAGTSGSSAPNWNQTTGGTQTDGSITWTNVNLGTGDASFACQAAIITVSQDGNWAVVPSSMFHNLGMDSTSQYRCDAFLVHIGQSNPVPSTYFGLHWKISNFPPLVPSGSVRLWDSLTRWQLLNPSNGVYDFTNLDTNLLDAKTLGVDVLFALSTTPNYISSDPTNATCNYNSTANGGCGVPTDIALSCTNVNGNHNCDGKTDGTLQSWDLFIYNTLLHIQGLDPNVYQVPSSYEIWNEFTQQGTSGAGTCNQVGGTSWEGTCAQLALLYSHANCIITGRGVGCTASAMGTPAVGLYPNAIVTTPDSVMTAPQSTQWGAYLLTSGALTNADVASVHAYTQGGSCCALPETVVTRYNTASGLLATAGGTQPIWSTEGGWGQVASEPDVDLQAAFVARYYLLGWNAGFKRLYWYSYDSLFGTLWTSGGGLTKAGVAYGQIYGWMVGSVLSTPCTAVSTVYSCVLTNATGDHLVMWDTSQTCSGGVCTTANQNVASTWLAYQDMTTASVPVAVAATHQVPIGAKPVIFQQSIVSHGAGVNPVILGMNRGPK